MQLNRSLIRGTVTRNRNIVCRTRYCVKSADACLIWTLIIILLSAAMEKAFVFLLGKVIRGVVKR